MVSFLSLSSGLDLRDVCAFEQKRYDEKRTRFVFFFFFFFFRSLEEYKRRNNNREEDERDVDSFFLFCPRRAFFPSESDDEDTLSCRGLFIGRRRCFDADDFDDEKTRTGTLLLLVMIHILVVVT